MIQAEGTNSLKAEDLEGFRLYASEYARGLGLMPTALFRANTSPYRDLYMVVLTSLLLVLHFV